MQGVAPINLPGFVETTALNVNIQSLMQGLKVGVFVHPNVGKKVNSLHDFRGPEKPRFTVPDREGPRLSLVLIPGELGPPACCLLVDWQFLDPV